MKFLLDDPLERLSFNEFRSRLSVDYARNGLLTEEQKTEMVQRIDERLLQYIESGGEPRQWETVLISE